MTKEKLYYQPIGFIANNQKAQTFVEEESERLLDAQSQIKKQNLPIGLGLKTTLLGRVHYDERERVARKCTKLLKEGINVSIDASATGPTRTMWETLFDFGITSCSSFSGEEGYRAIATGDLDQFPPNKNLEKMLELWELTRKTDAILGVGSRSVPVVLAANEENNYLRRIFEGVMNLTVRHAANMNSNKISLPDNYEIPNDPQYTKTGDFITGVYLVNHQNKGLLKFLGELSSTGRKNNFFLFEDEYLMAIAAGMFGNIAAINVNSVANPFSPINSEEEKETIIEDQIKAPLKKLANTPGRTYISETLSKTKTYLAEFYNEEKIDEVITYMSEAMSEALA